MTQEQMFIASLAGSFIMGFLGAVVAPMITGYVNKSKTSSEINLNVSQMVKQYMESGGDIAEMSIKIAARYELEVNKLTTKIDEQDKKIDELQEIVTLQNDYIKVIADAAREGGIVVPPRPDKLRESHPRMKAIKRW